MTNALVGFRLTRLEVYNWGTFNGRVWAMEPGGHTALLTGANGSGKSTLVDALLTLLVPNQKRNYNQAGGTEKRRERDEKSYVRGAYGRIKDEENGRGVVQYLRERGDYAVLLACFADGPKEVALAHVFFWREDELKKLYIVAPRRLSITDDLQITSTPDELRKRLKVQGADVYDEFVKYSRHMIKLFGLRSDKALDLFNQTVSIKEIGGLNEFVRQHMLEKTDAQEKITQLRETYQNLTRAHDAIAKAEAQLAQLAPLLQQAVQLAEYQARMTEAERCGALTSAYMARRKLHLLRNATDAAQAQVVEGRSRADALATQVEALRQQQIDLNVAISNDTAGQQLTQLRRDIAHITALRCSKEAQANKYNDVARKLTLPLYSDSATFFATTKQACAALAPLERRMQTLVTERDEHKQAEGRLLGVCQELRAEIESLRQRKSRIPAEDLRIRAALAEALSISADELPFVGELLRVRESERRWEGAVERLLRGYGRQLLVPDAQYQRVSGYVEATNLRGRLVYNRVDARRKPLSTTGFDADALIAKLDIKPDADLHDWLKADLLEHWEYVCCETLDQFGRERRALTLNGQIKRGGGQHEKDDRSNINDRTTYVLGWDNRDKLDALQADLDQRSAELKMVKDAIEKLHKEQKQRDEQRRLLHDLLRYDDFAALDWQTEARQITELQAQQQQLEASSDRLAHLQTQLIDVEARMKAVAGDLQRAQTLIGTQEHDIARFERQRAQSQQRLDEVHAATLDAHAALIAAEIKGGAVTLDTVDAVQGELERFFTGRAGSVRGLATHVERAMLTRMIDFKRDYPDDTHEMDASVEAVGEFRRLHERLERDDLPTHRKRFKEWLDGKVVDAIVGFQSALNKRVEEYRDSINVLNSALRRINYTPATYIQLTHDKNTDIAIADFRRTLRACIPDTAQRTPEANEASFQRIRALIGRFEKEERWTANVTDVRNWLEFAAEERYETDNTVKNYYSDSSGKSGGQKAKLAYTILASAIAYQYGLAQDEQPTRTFRFVVVDEAFSKSDEHNARYAMKLFEQLDLQLLVVTPLDKTHVVEPFIAACHFVTNTADENDSQVYNLTIEQYHAQKQRWKA